jgi:regulator of sigma E protease
MSWVAAIFALGFLIVVHEAGHYFVAKWCRMRVERFSVGFGPGVIKKTGKDGTIFQLAPIPFGGFVEIKGMNIAEEVDPDDAAAYPNRPAWQRFVTILAGPATNYISAIFLAFALYTCMGQPSNTYYVESLSQDSDAHGKVLPYDRIVAVDGKRFTSDGTSLFAPSATDLSKEVNEKAGKPVDLTVWRGHELVTVRVTPKLAKDEHGVPIVNKKTGKVQYLLGLSLGVDFVDVGIGESASDAFAFPVKATIGIVGGLRDIFTGKEDADPGGPVRIVKEFTSAFDRGLWEGINLLMVLSVYLGLFNLFPLPALDGGRLVFLGYEMVTRRRANPKIETMVHMGGIMVLMVVMILVTLRDCNVF